MAVTEFMDSLFAPCICTIFGNVIRTMVPLQHVSPYNMKGLSSVGAVGSCSMMNITCWLHTNVVMKVEKGRKQDFQPLISHLFVFLLLVSSFVRIKRCKFVFSRM